MIQNALIDNESAKFNDIALEEIFIDLKKIWLTLENFVTLNYFGVGGKKHALYPDHRSSADYDKNIFWEEKKEIQNDLLNIFHVVWKKFFSTGKANLFSENTTSQKNKPSKITPTKKTAETVSKKSEREWILRESEGLGIFEFDGKTARLGKVTNKPSLFINSLCPAGVPLGKEFKIEKVFDTVAPKDLSEYRTIEQKKWYLQRTFSDVRKKFAKTKIKIGLDFDTTQRTVRILVSHK